MRALLLLASFAVLGAGCLSRPGAVVPSSGSEHAVHHTENPHEDHVMPAAGLAKPANGRIVLHTTPSAAGRGVIVFSLKDVSGVLLGADALAVAHEKKLHVIVVSQDMRAYRHVHPESKDGQWRTEIDLPFGAYRLYADFVPLKGAPEVLHTTFTVGQGGVLIGELPEPGKDDQDANGDVTASMRREGDRFVFTLKHNGKIPKDWRPYLGAYGHVIILKHDSPNTYLHAHPITETAPVDGTLGFMAEVHGPGRSTAFAQFDIGGTIRTFMFTFDQD